MSRDVRRVVPHVVRLGLLGLGSVGAAFAELVDDDREGIDRRVGLKLEITRIAVHDTTKSRGKLRRLERITGDAAAVVSDPEVDVVVELVGGIEPARSLILAALRAGKPVVTANKELLAQDGPELFAVAESAGRPLLFEAAVAGAIPLVRALRVSLVGERVRRILGIVNGTTNYILSEMSEKGVSYASALETAQRLGYAERNPSADVGGHDAAAKAAILASIAFSADVVATDVYREGIEAIEIADIEFAHRLGYEVKLLAVAEQLDAVEGSPMIAVRVHPAMVPVEHPLATIRGPFNAVFVEGDSAGELMLFGRGAGGRPTASAVLGDVIDAAGSLGLEGGLRFAPRHRAEIRPIGELRAQYYVAIDVSDRPGVLAAVAAVFGQHNVSVRSMEQVGLGDEARLVFITHLARESDVQATLGDLARLDAVRRVGGLIRVVGQERDEATPA
ncbi:MAG: homoserine dehydrogenase [Acidimicrobiales bacterium]